MGEWRPGDTDAPEDAQESTSRRALVYSYVELIAARARECAAAHALSAMSLRVSFDSVSHAVSGVRATDGLGFEIPDVDWTPVAAVAERRV